jgi:hypothetical protein
VNVVRYEDLAARILAADPRAGTTRVLAVDGPAGSGKSTFAARLALAVGAPVVHTDDLCPGWNGLEEVAPLLLERVLRPLASGQSLRYRRYDWESGMYA